MSRIKGATALKPEFNDQESHETEIIPWPRLDDFFMDSEPAPAPRVRMDQKYLYYKGRQIPLNRFRKAGYGKLITLLVKEIGG
jgi:hypothetical protein